MFGSDLTLLCKLERGSVPTFFTQFLEQVENKGFMQEVGIYRFSGRQAEVQRLIGRINKGKILCTIFHENLHYDNHCVADSIKVIK